MESNPLHEHIKAIIAASSEELKGVSGDGETDPMVRWLVRLLSNGDGALHEQQAINEAISTDLPRIKHNIDVLCEKLGQRDKEIQELSAQLAQAQKECAFERAEKVTAQKQVERQKNDIKTLREAVAKLQNHNKRVTFVKHTDTLTSELKHIATMTDKLTVVCDEQDSKKRRRNLEDADAL